MEIRCALGPALWVLDLCSHLAVAVDQLVGHEAGQDQIAVIAPGALLRGEFRWVYRGTVERRQLGVFCFVAKIRPTERGFGRTPGGGAKKPITVGTTELRYLDSAIAG